MSEDQDRSLITATQAITSLKGIGARELSRCSTSEARAAVKFSVAERLNFLPLGLFKSKNKSILSCAITGEISKEREREIRFATGLEVTLQQVSEDILKEALFVAYHSDSQLLVSKASKLHRVKKSAESKAESILHAASGDSAQYLASLIEFAVAKGASDLHLTPRNDGGYARLRVDSQIISQDDHPIAHAFHEQMINRIKVLANLDPATKTKGQDGAFWLTISGKKVHVRVSTLPTLHGEMASLRFLGVGNIPEIHELGLLDRPREMFMEALTRKSGVIIFVGPTGSGKSTTMYSAVKTLSRKNLNVVTVEDPVEVPITGISQISINEKQGLNFGNTLRSVLRHDPDVILVGEIRDKDSATTALEAGLTGHLLLTTTHARSSFEVFLRLLGLNLDPVALSEAISLIICQRLLPRLCEACKVIDLTITKNVGVKVNRPVGCSNCDYSGYSGRILLAETLTMNTGLRECVLKRNISTQALMEHASKSNYWSLTKSLEISLKKGDISWEQLTSFIDNVFE